MRLLTLDDHGKLCVTRDLADDTVPSYAILSHTWGADEDEVTFQEIQLTSNRSKAGYKKIEFCRQQAYQDGLQHVWIDTCCIDRTNHVELSKAITCMYRWYQNASACYVYLIDVSMKQSKNSILADSDLNAPLWQSSFRTSRWFTRGWTLQELLAPKELVFYSAEGERLGTKDELKDLIHEITGVPTLALAGQPLSQFSTTERLRWSQGRKTKEKEDQAYCLLGIFNVFMPLIYGEGDNALVRLMKAINDVPKVTIPLKVVDGASFDSYGQTHQGCHPATRLDLLQSMRDWMRDVKGKSIFWLNGAAGTGKSTLSWTVAKWLSGLDTSDTVALGASFFFKRGEGDRASAALLFSTIAIQLASNVTDFDVFLAQTVRADPQIASKSLGEQFDKLLLKPLRQAGSGTRCMTYVIILDALDECKDEDDIRVILRLWSILPITGSIRFRLFLTSRPELVIRLGFKGMSTDIHKDLVLHEVPRPIIQHDIQTFLTDAFAKIRQDYNLILDDDLVDEQLADDWPGDKALQELTQRSTPLFIVAATIYRLIRDTDRPRQRLETILRSQKSAHLTEMGKVYLLVLQAMATSLKDEQEMSQVHHEFRTIVGAIITLAEPLSRTALAALLELTPVDVQVRLRSLHAVLQVPSDGKTPIRPLHLSFSEYLTSREVQGTPYCVDPVATHRSLWKQCLQLLSGSTGLHENMCHFSHPGQVLSEIPSTHIDEFLLPELQYACRYWVHHVQESTYRICDEDDIHIFLERHFLHWLEALSCMNRLTDAIDFIMSLRSIILIDRSSRLEAFLEDARRFVLAFRYIGEQAPLQLYSSATAFAPQDSVIRRVCGRLPPWMQLSPVTPPTWNLELQKLEGHRSDIVAVTFSPSGLLIASASRDTTVRLWDTRTGREIQTLEGHTSCVNAVAFSPDGSLVVSGSSDFTLRLWDTKTGRAVQTLKGHKSFVSALAFSPCGLFIASGSRDKTVRLWDVTTCREIQTLTGHTDRVDTMTFLNDGLLIVSAARLNSRGSVRIWDLKTCQEIITLQRHICMTELSTVLRNNFILASRSYQSLSLPSSATTGRNLHGASRHWTRGAALSPDHRYVASRSHNSTVRIWDMLTGKDIQTLDGHTRGVIAVAFSPSEFLLASASYDRTIRLWDLTIGQEVLKLETHIDQVRSVLFSYDGSLLASTASSDRTVRLWDTQTGRNIQKLEGHVDAVNTVVFSPTSSFLASASDDSTVRLWESNTGREVQRLKGYNYKPITFSPSGALLATVSKHSKVRLWDARTGQKVQKLGVEIPGIIAFRNRRYGGNGFDAVKAMTFSYDSAFIALGLNDGTARLWDLKTSREVKKLEGHTGNVTAVVFSPDGSYIASGSLNYEWPDIHQESTVRLWDTRTGQELWRLEGHSSEIEAISFSHDGLLFASASHYQLRLWDTKTGQILQEMKDVGEMHYLKFLPNNSTLLTNQGYIRTIQMEQSSGAVIGHGLRRRGDWIECRGQKLLWLPQEYRSGIEAVFENTIAIGRANGHVAILQKINCPRDSISLRSNDTPTLNTTDSVTDRADRNFN